MLKVCDISRSLDNIMTVTVEWQRFGVEFLFLVLAIFSLDIFSTKCKAHRGGISDILLRTLNGWRRPWTTSKMTTYCSIAPVCLTLN